MRPNGIGRLFAFYLFSLLIAGPASAQGTRADYEQADSFDARTRGLVVDVAESPRWIGDTQTFWYRKTVEGGHTFVFVDAENQMQRPAFDHQRLAAGLRQARGGDPSAVDLPFSRFQYLDDNAAIEFLVADSTWRCDLSSYACENQGPVANRGNEGGGENGSGVPWQAGPGQLWRNLRPDPVQSPDGNWEAFIQNHNLAVRRIDEDDFSLLSHEGSVGNTYTNRSIVWSPDSRKVAVYRVIPGEPREVHYVQSSPEDQIQPKHSTLLYAKPGDRLDKERPVVFDVETGRQAIVDDALFPNAYSLSPIRWREDSRAFTFEYNQRGHQVFRIIEVDAETGAARAVISEEPETFFDYSGKRFRYELDDGAEVIWMSERDGWNHLYLYDGATGEVKNQITSGEYVVRGVDHVDEDARQIWFRASGVLEEEDPYFVHAYRIDLDGSDMVRLTDGHGTHSISYGPDTEYFVDHWSRVDQPPVMELRRAQDGLSVMELERADASALLATGWTYPEVFVAKGRDGETDIWGIIVRPTDFDPSQTYPVIEYIYAGPHSSHVPKTFTTQRRMQALAELGFIVAQMDGMGTSNRSKAFHDVAWKNLGDAGFPDRILWHQAAASRYDHYDISNMGIFGNSAGGQNSLGALLFHHDFYKVAVSTSGCHDNRMDKIWWNELWMSWPLGPHYDASSNVVNAHRLEGKLFLLVPEMDTNVDPASSMQVVNALIEAGKDFDFMVVPNANHGSGGDFGVRKRYDFFVRHILGVEPPDWNGG